MILLIYVLGFMLSWKLMAYTAKPKYCWGDALLLFSWSLFSWISFVLILYFSLFDYVGNKLNRFDLPRWVRDLY